MRDEWRRVRNEGEGTLRVRILLAEEEKRWLSSPTPMIEGDGGEPVAECPTPTPLTFGGVRSLWNLQFYNQLAKGITDVGNPPRQHLFCDMGQPNAPTSVLAQGKDLRV